MGGRWASSRLKIERVFGGVRTDGRLSTGDGVVRKGEMPMGI